MSYDVDKILGRIDGYYKCPDDLPQAKEPEKVEQPEDNNMSVEFLEFWVGLEDRRKARDLESSKEVHKILRAVKIQTLDDQLELMERFRESLTF